MILGPGGIARCAVGVHRGWKNSFEHLDQLQDTDFEPRLLGEFPRDTLFERFSDFEQPSRGWTIPP